jgi:hypothetical protein
MVQLLWLPSSLSNPYDSDPAARWQSLSPFTYRSNRYIGRSNPRGWAGRSPDRAKHASLLVIVRGRWYEGNSEAELSMGLTQPMMINELNLRIVERNHALLCL